MAMFHNRRSELEGLESRFHSGKPEFFVLYGRRRIGKSALIQEFCRGKPHVYFLASQVREPDNLDQFREALGKALDDPGLDSVRFPSWDAALNYVNEAVGRQPFILALDEFPYLCQDNPALPSVFQKWWDSQGRRSRIFLLLSGSQIAFMERGVLAERSPLYGRRTGQLRLDPLLPWDAARFLTGYSRKSRLAAYGVLGGVPAYLERVDPRHDLRENLLREAFHVQGFLYDEGHFLLRTELDQVHTYLSLLKAISGGATRISEIAARAGLPVTAASSYMQTLRDLGLVRREVSFVERRPEKSKKGVYQVADPFLAFWCRFVLPHQSLIQAGQGAVVWKEFVEPVLDTHLGVLFEDVCRQFVLHRWAAIYGQTPRRVGRLWSGDYDIDVMAELVSGKATEILVGECKWWKSQVGINVLDDLRIRSARLPRDRGHAIRLVLFSVSGFTEALRERAARDKVYLVDARDLL